MEENFLSLDDILLSQERLPVRTECAFPRLGFLEKSSDTQDIPEVGERWRMKQLNNPQTALCCLVLTFICLLVYDHDAEILIRLTFQFVLINIVCF